MCTPYLFHGDVMYIHEDAHLHYAALDDGSVHVSWYRNFYGRNKTKGQENNENVKYLSAYMRIF